MAQLISNQEVSLSLTIELTRRSVQSCELFAVLWDGDRLRTVSEIGRRSLAAFVDPNYVDRLRQVEDIATDLYSLVQPELLAQIEFTEWTPDEHLRHSKFVGIREDKNPREISRESKIVLSTLL